MRDGGVWRGEAGRPPGPTTAPYLACDSDGWQIRCGIESWFPDQDDAQVGERLGRDGAVATLRVDDHGNAALVGLDVR